MKACEPWEEGMRRRRHEEELGRGKTVQAVLSVHWPYCPYK